MTNHRYFCENFFQEIYRQNHILNKLCCIVYIAYIALYTMLGLAGLLGKIRKLKVQGKVGKNAPFFGINAKL